MSARRNSKEGTSMLNPFPFYYTELPTFQSVIASLKERDNMDVKNYEDSWFTVCIRNNIFQVWNKEYIEALSKEIPSLIRKDLVLEVAAGDGMLSHWLREYGVNIKATDNMSWHNKEPNERVPPLKLHSEVEKLDAISAIRKYKPRMVISSWIPYGSEIDCEILDEDPEYLILIGEGDGGCTGSSKFWEDFYWKQKGYTKHDLDVDTWNLCRTDYGHSYGRSHGSTVLYTRLNAQHKKTLKEDQ